ncbi:MAG: hypothetical protein JXX29_06525, partial [Deltaproteobacteria bacterium]|nr:hypothetical protein [Deltaproteobacteria bacterium]
IGKNKRVLHASAMRTFLIFFTVLSCCICGGASLHAREVNSFEVGLGGQFAFTTHDLCSRDADLVSCRTTTFGIGPQIFGYYHFTKRVAVGIRGSFWQTLDSSRIVSSDGSSSRAQLALWRATGAFRFTGVQTEKAAWWLDWELGASGASDSYIDAAIDARRIHQMGFALGMATGLDFIVKKRWVIGFEFRALLLVFGGAPNSVDDVLATELGTAVWPAIGLIHVGYRF